MSLGKRPQRVAVVRVAVQPHAAAARVDLGGRRRDVRSEIQDLCDLVRGVHEHEAAHPGELRPQRVGQVQRELGERRHRPGDIREDYQLGLGRPPAAEHRRHRHPAGGHGMPGGPAEVERAAPPVPLPCGKPGRELAGHGRDDRPQRVDLSAGGSQEVNVFWQRCAQRPGHVVRAPVGDHPPPDLRLHFPLKLRDAPLVLLRQQHPREPARAGIREQPGGQRVRRHRAHRADQVVGARDTTPRLDARVAAHVDGGQRARQRRLVRLQRRQQQRPQSLVVHRVQYPARARPLRARLRPAARASEVQVEDRGEGALVRRVLDQRGTERGLDRRALA
jgi:hypothetical protein